eukprot:1054981-Amphidinium_carterae.1
MNGIATGRVTTQKLPIGGFQKGGFLFVPNAIKTMGKMQISTTPLSKTTLWELLNKLSDCGADLPE